MLNLRKSLTKFSKLALAAVIAVPALAAGLPALAATNDIDSSAKVEFTMGDPIVKPVDPTDPKKDDPNPGPTPGPGPNPINGMAINKIEDLDFGTNKISASNEEYDALNTKTRMPHVQITDVRGLGQGWKLSLKASEFSDGTNIVKGIRFLFKNGDAINNQGSTQDAPELTSATSTVEIATGGVSMLMASTKDPSKDGVGTWVLRWQEVAGASKNENVKLYVPSGSVKKAGSYTSTLTWTLEDTI